MTDQSVMEASTALRDAVIVRVALDQDVPAGQVLHGTAPRVAHARQLAMMLTASIFDDDELADLFETTARSVRRAREKVAMTAEAQALGWMLVMDEEIRALRARVSGEIGVDDDLASA